MNDVCLFKQILGEPSDALLVDEAEVHEGLRTHFPLSFGRQEGKSVSLETIHSKTKRAEPKSSEVSEPVIECGLFYSLPLFLLSWLPLRCISLYSALKHFNCMSTLEESG